MENIYIFDFDGTICDLDIDWSSWHYGLGQIFTQFVPEFDLHLKGQKVHEYQNIYIRQFGKPLRDMICSFNAEYEQINLKKLIPHPKAISKIKMLKDPKFLWTANSRSTISHCLNKLGLENSFVSWVTRDEVDFIKPDPQGFDMIHNTSTDLLKYLFVGDTKHDEQAANLSGIKFMYISEYEND